MTQDNRLIVDRALYHALQWYPVGTPFPPEGLDVPTDLLKAYQTEGYLITAKTLARRENPAAAAAQAGLEQSSEALTQARAQVAALQPVLELLTDASGALPTPEQAFERVKTLQEREQVLGDARALLREKDPGLSTDDLQAALRSLLSDRQALAIAQKDLAALRLLNAGTPGTELPTSFLRRGALVKFGLTTYEALLGKTADQLDALEGVDKEQALKIVTLVEAWSAKQASQAPAPAAPAESERGSDVPPAGEPTPEGGAPQTEQGSGSEQLQQQADTTQGG